jgi:hypothetical protein
MWTGALQMGGQRLADRAATYQAGVALLRPGLTVHRA